MHRVHLSEFEGPLDLLLFFIRRDELDIYDIPISRIADEYLETVRALQDLDLDDIAPSPEASAASMPRTTNHAPS